MHRHRPVVVGVYGMLDGWMDQPSSCQHNWLDPPQLAGNRYAAYKQGATRMEDVPTNLIPLTKRSVYVLLPTALAVELMMLCVVVVGRAVQSNPLPSKHATSLINAYCANNSLNNTFNRPQQLLFVNCQQSMRFLVALCATTLNEQPSRGPAAVAAHVPPHPQNAATFTERVLARHE